MTKYYDEKIAGLNSAELWRAGSHKYTDKRGDSSHLYTFCLTSDKDKEETADCCAIDEVVGRHFAVDEAEMVGDNSIFLLATR